MAAFSMALVLLSAFASAQAPPVDYCALPSTTKPSLPAVLMPGMGKVHLTITTRSPEAQKFFDQGLAQLHAFWFVEAERSFMQAAVLDPNAAMAYWGIAAAAGGDHRPAFQLPRLRSNAGQPAPSPASSEGRARDAVSKAMDLRSQVTAQERLYIEAQAARRNPASKDIDTDYIRALRKLTSAFPNDLEARSILALTLDTGYDPSTRQARKGTIEAVGLLQGILSIDPNHVGAHHYLIHALEGGPDIRNASASAKRLPELVPGSPHAVHMPGHVYSQTARWSEAAGAFGAVADLERSLMRKDALYDVSHFVHNQVFWIYVAGVQGRFKQATSLAGELLAMKENPRERANVNGTSAYRQGWFALMRTLVRFEKWDVLLDAKTLREYPQPREQAWIHWAQGLAGAAKGDVRAAAQSYRKMRAAMDTLQRSFGWVPAELGVAMTELEGYIEVRSGRPSAGFRTMERAADAELELPYAEPPAYPRPVRELLGSARLAAGVPAAFTYETLLRQEPGSGRAFWGLARALGKRSEADKVWQDFDRAWALADPGLLSK